MQQKLTLADYAENKSIKMTSRAHRICAKLKKKEEEKKGWFKIKLPRKIPKTETLASGRNGCFCSRHDALAPLLVLWPASPLDYNHYCASNAVPSASRTQVNLQLPHPWNPFTSATTLARKMASTPSLLPQIAPSWIKVSCGWVSLAQNSLQAWRLTTKDTGKYLSGFHSLGKWDSWGWKFPQTVKSAEKPENKVSNTRFMWGTQEEQSHRW